MSLRNPCIALLCAAAACGGGSGDPLASSSGFFDQYTAAICAQQARCCTGYTINQQSCQTANRQFLVGYLSAFFDAAATYHPAAAAACGAQWKSSTTCAVPPPICDGVFAGSVANGAPCTSQNDCASNLCINGAWANDIDNAFKPLSGTCAAQGAVNAPCPSYPAVGNSTTNGDQGSLCAPGSWENATSNTTCTCAPLLADGAPCRDGGVAGADSSRCASGYCDPTSYLCAEIPQTSSFDAATCQRDVTPPSN